MPREVLAAGSVQGQVVGSSEQAGLVDVIPDYSSHSPQLFALLPKNVQNNKNNTNVSLICVGKTYMRSSRHKEDTRERHTEFCLRFVF